MEDRMPWSTWAAVAVLALVTLTWVLGFVLLWMGASVGLLVLFLAAWLSMGALYTVLRGPAEEVVR